MVMADSFWGERDCVGSRQRQRKPVNVGIGGIGVKSKNDSSIIFTLHNTFDVCL